ncbi:tetratricopeptide repeat protein 38 isoform X1 [Amborella trichopoda]|uniref:tetratricopeptide repeat protein 38 isoform X1 n=1 Tax=Amborella trichopoda TaxID=13333 RepID=UPI0009C16135|nr:tetratricopeptide repeat protein 38 isoform X1 [Amborella trichopoda]|eukprot:XP_020521913.1 tetratricopeptide repeat protein 38 isoform X1 [Amborella trichopoda]
MEGESTVKFDRWGSPVTTTSDACISLINSYYHQVLCYGRERKVIMAAMEEDRECVLANALAALFLFSRDTSAASRHLQVAAARLGRATSYEKLLYDSVSSIMNGTDCETVVALHSKLLREFPRDLASLNRAQALCFYMGRPDLSLGLVEQQVLPENQQESYIYGMLAFPLLELGRMSDAEISARKGLEINKSDPWSQHALCHVFQYECHFREAVKFMEECSPSWIDCSSFMYTHNWWHVALCYMDGHSPLNRILDIYDRHIWAELQRDDADCAEVYLNALGLWLRVDVRGWIGYTGNRLRNLANCLLNQESWHVDWLLDLLSVWALAHIGEIPRAEDLVKSIKSRLYSMSQKKQQSLHKGVLLAEALFEYGRGDYQHAYDILGPDFNANNFKVIGASDEQLDVFNEVWYTILLNTGYTSKAIGEIEKRLQHRSGVPFLWNLLEKAYILADKREDAAVAKEKVTTLEHAYFKQVL